VDKLAEVTVKGNETQAEAVVGALLKEATGGSVPAIREVFDRVDGQAPLEISAPDGSVVFYLPPNGRESAPEEE